VLEVTYTLLFHIYIEKYHLLQVIMANKRPRSGEVVLLLKFQTAIHLCGDLALDEGKSLVAVDVDVLLVVVGVVSVAAVRVLGVAIALDDAGTGGCAAETRRAGSEALRLAGAHVVGKSVAVVGIAHENSDLDGFESVAGEGGSGTTADGVVHDLTSLR
jgi:hypothetical protein